MNSRAFVCAVALPLLIYLATYLRSAIQSFSAGSGSCLMPGISLRHLQRMTDAVGIHEFAHGTVPARENGYCAEDVARALVAVTMHEQVTGSREGWPLAQIYLSYLENSTLPDGSMWNRTGTMKTNGDSYARVLWGLGYAASYHSDRAIAEPAGRLFLRIFPDFDAKLRGFPIARAYAIQGMACFLARHADAEVRAKLVECADALVVGYRRNSDADWKWFSDVMTYDTGRLPLAMLEAFLVTGDDRYRQVGLESLDFLIATCCPDGAGRLQVVGNQGWYAKGGRPAVFDQQPIDPASIVEVCAAAARMTGYERYAQCARTAFEWFLGNNVGGTPMYDADSGGCRDGLGEGMANGNQGGESTIMCLIARCTMERMGESGG